MKDLLNINLITDILYGYEIMWNLKSGRNYTFGASFTMHKLETKHEGGSKETREDPERRKSSYANLLQS